MRLTERSLSRLLAGGERQKVCLAMLLAPESEYLLLDEPMTFLDFNVQADFFELCQILKTAGKTIVLVLHDLSAAYHVSDELIVLDRGTAAAQGTKETILDKGVFPEVFHFNCESVVSGSGEIRFFQ